MVTIVHEVVEGIFETSLLYLWSWALDTDHLELTLLPFSLFTASYWRFRRRLKRDKLAAPALAQRLFFDGVERRRFFSSFLCEIEVSRLLRGFLNLVSFLVEWILSHSWLEYRGLNWSSILVVVWHIVSLLDILLGIEWIDIKIILSIQLLTRDFIILFRLLDVLALAI